MTETLPKTPASKPRLLVVSGTPPPFSGPEVMTAQLLASPLKEKVDIFHFNISKGRAVNTKAKFDLMNILYGVLQPFQLVWLMFSYRPDVIYTNLAQNLGGFLRYSVFILVIALFRTPVIVRVMGDGFGHFYRSANPVLRALINLTIQHIDRFIVRAGVLKKQFAGLVPQDKLCVVYSGIDTSEFDGPDKPLLDGQIRVLFVGYLTKAKGALDLLQAVPEIVTQHPEVHFQLMGPRIDVERNITYITNPNSNESILGQLLEGKEVKEHVHLLGILTGEGKREIYCSADIFVLPSYSEAFPTVVLEAMAAGLPVIATPVGALPEVFDDRNILFIEPGNVNQISEAIIRLAKDREMRLSMGLYNRQDVNNRFNLDTHAAAMGEIIAEVLKITL